MGVGMAVNLIDLTLNARAIETCVGVVICDKFGLLGCMRNILFCCGVLGRKLSEEELDSGRVAEASSTCVRFARLAGDVDLSSGAECRSCDDAARGRRLPGCAKFGLDGLRCNAR